MAAEGLPDKCAGAHTSSDLILNPVRTGNAELHSTYLRPFIYAFCFSELNFSCFGQYMNVFKS